jgi:hypothetical protein
MAHNLSRHKANRVSGSHTVTDTRKAITTDIVLTIVVYSAVRAIAGRGRNRTRCRGSERLLPP